MAGSPRRSAPRVGLPTPFFFFCCCSFVQASRFKRQLRGPVELVAGPGPQQYFTDETADPRSFLHQSAFHRTNPTPAFVPPLLPTAVKDPLALIPGPGAYEPRLTSSRSKSLPSYAFCSRSNRIQYPRSFVPGPGEYDPALPSDYDESYQYAYPFSSTLNRRDPFAPTKDASHNPAPNSYTISAKPASAPQTRRIHPPPPAVTATILADVEAQAEVEEAELNSPPSMPIAHSFGAVETECELQRAEPLADREARLPMHSAFATTTKRMFDDLCKKAEGDTNPAPCKYYVKVQQHKSFHKTKRWSQWL
eukprot:TRINITY_DN346_c0_g1_i2.p1 TRINITY_DN346_c0_g1~~TRINITY_DN346_c0_g1_i2.p1  ORF type:complete len:307 (+),score=36.88 TRINITY_DN346_c0_g1_i2:331-1251(+)